ncbi:MAG: hypothetical protein PHO12_02390 [Bacteroidales bacterium]|nr:hypothetical protein [Bacteroidales bacterium]MDD4684047.1 hypothetical protein [Bacteroidales bacterium]
MKKNKIQLRFSIISIIIIIAAMSRLIPHPANFAPIGAIALFGSAYYSKRYWMYVIPIFSIWLSDLVLNNIVYGQYFEHFVWFYGGSLFTYAAFAIIVLMGRFGLKNIKFQNVFFSTIGASIIFFIVSNFGVWVSSGLYPHTFLGLQTCYIAGIPFFNNTLIGDFVYTGLLFGVFELLQFKFPILRLEKAEII